jgi:hypothetical protein
MSLSPVVVRDLPSTLAPTEAPEVAYAEMLPLIEAVTDEQLVAINLDIPAVVSVVLDKAPHLLTLAEAAAAELRVFDIERFARLPKIALALAYAHAVLLAGTSAETDDLGPLYESAVELRGRLMDDASYLVKKGLLEASRLEQVKGLSGYRNVAFDLLVIVRVMKDSWGVAAQKSAASEEEVAKADLVAARILQALSAREQLAAASTKAAVTRHKAYSLLFRECDAIQRVASFLRWDQDDAEAFAPSVFSTRRRPRKAVAAAPGTPAVPVTPGMPSVPAIPPIPPIPSPVQASGLPLHAAPEASVPAGHQGGSPFTS